MTSKSPTHFLPPERSDDDTLNRQRQLFADSSPHRSLLDAIPNALVVLNDRRQIVYANAQFRDLSKYSDLDELLGQRVGEARTASTPRTTADAAPPGSAPPAEPPTPNSAPPTAARASRNATSTAT